MRLSLEAPFQDLDRFEVLIQSLNRCGAPLDLHPLNAKLTGVTADWLSPLETALARLGFFSAGDVMWA